MGEQRAIVVGDYDLRGLDLDAVFGADRLSDTCIDAIARVSARFDSRFPGWLLYRRVAGGCGLFDRQLEAWAISCTRMLSRAKQKNGHPYIAERVRGPEWIAQAGRDALDFAIFGRYQAGSTERAARFKIKDDTYRKLRDPAAKSMWIGMETFRGALHVEYWQVRRDERLAGISVG
jgi:hypothetical protein